MVELHLIHVLLQVVSQRGCIRGSIRAIWASKRLFPSVYPRVFLNGILCGGTIVTVSTVERLLACVSTYVDPQVIFPSSGIVTKITLMHLAAGCSPTKSGTTFLQLYL